jgi:hypothetical protein
MRFSRGPSHLNRVFPGLSGSPSELSAIILPTIEAWGTSRLQQREPVHQGQTGDGVAIGNLVSAQVPADEIWYIPYLSALQDGNVNRTIKVYVRTPDPSAGLSNLTQIANQVADANSVAAIVNQPFYLPPLCQLQAFTVSALVAATTFSLDFLRVRLALGEAIRVF